MKTLLKILLRIFGVFLMVIGTSLILAANLQTVVAFQTVSYMVIFIFGACLLNLEVFSYGQRRISIYALSCFILALIAFSIPGGAIPLGTITILVVFVLSSIISGIMFVIRNKQEKGILHGKGLVSTGIVLDVTLLFVLSIPFIYNPHYHYNKGNVHYSKGEYDQAITKYNLALKQETQFFAVYYERGLAYAAKGNYSQAIADYTEKINSPSNKYHTNGEEYYARAIAYFKTSEYDKCWEDVNKAIDLNYRVHPEFLRELKKATGREK